MSNPEASIDSLLMKMGESPEEPAVVFEDGELIESADVHIMLDKKIRVLMNRKVLKPLDVKLLDVLLKHCRT